MHPGQKLKPGARVVFERDSARIDGEVLDHHFFGRRTIRLTVEHGSVADAIDAIGHIPLPPYIHRPDTADDRERYQTVFARRRGSIAAPTAGLHFDDTLLGALDDAGVTRVSVTLHVGYGTFKPVRVDTVDDARRRSRAVRHQPGGRRRRQRRARRGAPDRRRRDDDDEGAGDTRRFAEKDVSAPDGHRPISSFVRDIAFASSAACSRTSIFRSPRC